MPYLDYPRCTLTIKNSLDVNFLSMWILNLNIRPFNRFRIHFELFDNLFVSPRPALIAVNWLKYSNDCPFLVLNKPFRMSAKLKWVRRRNEFKGGLSSKAQWVKQNYSKLFDFWVFSLNGESPICSIHAYQWKIHRDSQSESCIQNFERHKTEEISMLLNSFLKLISSVF